MMKKKDDPRQLSRFRPYLIAILALFSFLILSLSYGLSFALENGLHSFLILMLIGSAMCTILYYATGQDAKLFLTLMIPYTLMSVFAVLLVYGFGSKSSEDYETPFPKEQSNWYIILNDETRTKHNIHIDLLPDYDMRQRHLAMDWQFVNIRHIAAAEIEDEQKNILMFPCAQFRSQWHILTPNNPRFVDFITTNQTIGKDMFKITTAKDMNYQSLKSYDWLTKTIGIQ
ncbi:hypothetical protein AKO1_003640 [Acrasis kona]|uniref:Uncharacterized protein n=1 Tax=Acrasis kona TaxID=1008807 RepID=A0AAW2Z873_9EUKA